MRTQIKLVDKVRVAAPCTASWEAMKGDERKRFCEGCGLHVHNLSSMTRRDAESLLKANPEHLCVRYGQRSDGRIVTDNCPPRLRPARALLLKRFAAIASFGLLLFNFTCRAIAGVQGAPKKEARSKAANKKKQAKAPDGGDKSTSRLQMILGRRIAPLNPAAPAVHPPIMGKPAINNITPQTPKAADPGATSAAVKHGRAETKDAFGDTITLGRTSSAKF